VAVAATIKDLLAAAIHGIATSSPRMDAAERNTGVDDAEDPLAATTADELWLSCLLLNVH
jgi:hypothetical protein